MDDQHKRDAEDHAFNLFFVDLQIQPIQQAISEVVLKKEEVESYPDYQGLKISEFAFGRLLAGPRNVVLNSLMVYHFEDWEKAEDG